MVDTSTKLFLRGDVYYAWVPHPRTGRVVPKSTGHRTESEAVAWRRRYIRAANDPAGVAARTVTVRAVLDDFLESRAARTKNDGRPLSKETLAFLREEGGHGRRGARG
jgi:hypothetical protein